MQLIHHYLSETASRNPGKVALVFGDRQLTYGEFERAASGLASHLRTNGVEAGDRVLIFSENSPEAAIAIFGASMAGGMFVCVNHQTPALKVARLLELTEPSAVVVSESCSGTLKDALGRASHRPRVLVPIGLGFLGRFHSQHGSGLVDDGPDATSGITEPAAIILTSGSVGEPKGVVHTHHSIDSVVGSVNEYLRNHDNDRILCVLQLSSSYGLLQLLGTVRTGATLVLQTGLGLPYDLVKAVKGQRITGLAGVPTLWASLLQLTSVRPEELETLAYVTNAADRMPEPFVPRLRNMLPKTRIFLMHGQTECFRTTFLPPEQIDRKPTSVGKGMKGVELWLEREDGKRAAHGESGVMCVRGHNLMSHYWKDPEGTRRVIRGANVSEDRVLSTGDVFRIDEDGDLHFLHRSDEVVKVRGEKVSRAEVEDVLYRLDAIQECRVFGTPDPMLGSSMSAQIVLRPGVTLTQEAVRNHCGGYLEAFKIPRVITFVDELPRTLGGKLIRGVDALRGQ